ncbi:MAG: hypothetical protein RR475_02385 [Clostridia bacterium]
MAWTKNRRIAASIVELFEDLLDEKGIEVPCSDEMEQKERYNDGNSAKLYGTEYWNLVQEVEEYLDKKGAKTE